MIYLTYVENALKSQPTNVLKFERTAAGLWHNFYNCIHCGTLYLAVLTLGPFAWFSLLIVGCGISPVIAFFHLAVVSRNVWI